MGTDNINLLIIAAVIAAVAGAAAYFVARFLKGRIRISLPRASFAAGEMVEGSFALEAKKEIRGNGLLAALVATETYTERDFKGRSHRKTREVQRISHTVEAARVYPPGYTANYNFKIGLPAGGLGGDVGAALGGVLSLLGGFGRRVDWRVEVRLDAEGVDLASSERIHVA